MLNRPGGRTAGRRRVTLLLAAVAFAAVSVGRITVDDPNELVGLMFVIPVALVAAEFGLLAGLVVAALASVAVVVWSLADASGLSALGYVVRLVTFWLVGGLVGRLADERTQSAAEVDRWFEMSNDMLAVANLEGYFVRLNPTWERCLGFTANELIARPYLEFVHPDDRQPTIDTADALSHGSGEIIDFENRYRASDGSYRWLLWSARADGKQIYAVAKDISDRKAAETEHRQLLERANAVARTDPLTGLGNRRAWEEELQREVARARRKEYRLAIVMLDVDHFKKFNDDQGHQAGDALLRELAASWRMKLRVTDVVARYGGDEFGMLLPDCPESYAEDVLGRIRSASPSGCTCSAGIAYWDGDEPAETLLARADAALYMAKRGGRNQAVTAGAR